MQTKPSQMTTLTDVLEKLRQRKQDNEFVMTDKGFKSKHDKYYQPDELTIFKTYRFEGESNPDDSSILYLLEAKDGTIGYSMDAYGVYSNQTDKYNEFIRQVKVEDRDEQIIFGE